MYESVTWQFIMRWRTHKLGDDGSSFRSLIIRGTSSYLQVSAIQKHHIHATLNRPMQEPHRKKERVVFESEFTEWG